jgi:hypothetical protein
MINVVTSQTDKPAAAVGIMAPQKQEKQVESVYVEEQDPEGFIVYNAIVNFAQDAVISVGTKCKRSGCNRTYKDLKSRKEECEYHPGAPYFHEATKIWSCCQKKAMEFDKFLEIPGCQLGLHKFMDFKKDVS